MSLVRVLAQAAQASGSIYKIVFTTIMLYELVRFKTKGKVDAEDSVYHRGHNRHGSGNALRTKKAKGI